MLTAIEGSVIGLEDTQMENRWSVSTPNDRQTVEIVVSGVVQGVGFRPFVYRVARRFGICGTVHNDGRGVTIVVQASSTQINSFVDALKQEHPPLAKLASVRVAPKQTSEIFDSFGILKSDATLPTTAWAPADSFVCEDCRRELFDPGDRRFRYPFINCTNCGPRYSIIERMPYDRTQTTMRDFTMCPQCQAEYDDPGDRRFHAQPNACPVCGPSLQLVDRDGAEVATADIVGFVKEALRGGAIVAIKGVGGFHLAVSPFDEQAVRELRSRKKRDAKPFALLAPAVETVRRYALVAPMESEVLASPARPIVLLSRSGDSAISHAVAPRSPLLGFMLPSTPLHYLLVSDDDLPALVMTSGNLSGHPICYTNQQALRELGQIADYILLHNRSIHTRVDDSVVRVSDIQGPGAPSVIFLRRSRGFAPQPIHLPGEGTTSVLAFGAELKTTVALSRNGEVFVSQHIGDIKNDDTFTAHQAAADHLASLNEIHPEVIACDLHPAFRATREALKQSAFRVELVQHHHAHMASCMAENGLTGRTIGVIFDGAGYGADGTIWGSEFLVGDYAAFGRAGHLRSSLLLGGDKAVREPVRSAIALLVDSYGSLALVPPSIPPLQFLSEEHRDVYEKMFLRGINSVPHTSMGRLFDGVASLLGLCHIADYEGHGPIDLEALLGRDQHLAEPLTYALEQDTDDCLVIDFRPIVRDIVNALVAGVPDVELSRRFHSTIVEIVVDVCGHLSLRHATRQIVLSGGVFLNEFLLTNVCARLRSQGYAPFHQTAVPVSDGGISLGQVAVAQARSAASRSFNGSAQQAR